MTPGEREQSTGGAAYLVQLLLPTHDNEGRPIADHHFRSVPGELTDRFGGVAAYQSSPAAGAWKRDDGTVDGDEVVMVEVEAPTLDRSWWRSYQQQLERKFKQDKILIRAIQVESL
jgi:hypothetical protein